MAEKLETRIPDIDGQPQILWWEFDEIVVMVGAMVFGIAYDMVILCTILGFFLAKMLERMKMENAEGYHVHFLWWHGIMPMVKLKIPSYIKEFYE